MTISQAYKSLDFETPSEYYEYIIESYQVGQKQQCIDLYNDLDVMGKAGFRSFIWGESKQVIYDVLCLFLVG